MYFVFSFVGKKPNVNKAVAEIQKIQNEMANITSKEIKIPAKIHNTMIGAGGKLIQSIMNDCGGVSVNFQSWKQLKKGKCLSVCLLPLILKLINQSTK